MTYRIARNDLGYYPQVRIWWVWMRISRHVHGFGLYNDLDHPCETFHECDVIIFDYTVWRAKSRKLRTVKTIIVG